MTGPKVEKERGHLRLPRARAPLTREKAIVRRARVLLTRARAPRTRARAIVPRVRAPLTRARAIVPRVRVPLTRVRVPLTRARAHRLHLPHLKERAFLPNLSAETPSSMLFR